MKVSCQCRGIEIFFFYFLSGGLLVLMNKVLRFFIVLRSDYVILFDSALRI